MAYRVNGNPDTTRTYLSELDRHILYMGEQMIVPKESGNTFDSSHWLDLEGDSLGIMDPRANAGEIKVVKRSDLTVLDAVGWDVNSQSYNISPPLMNFDYYRDLISNPHGLGPIDCHGPTFGGNINNP